MGKKPLLGGEGRAVGKVAENRFILFDKCLIPDFKKYSLYKNDMDGRKKYTYVLDKSHAFIS